MASKLRPSDVFAAAAAKGSSAKAKPAAKVARAPKPVPSAPAPAPEPAPAAAAIIEREAMGQRLRAIRKQQQLTLKEVSQRSGVTLPTLSKMELGQVSISYDKFAAVAKALEVDLARLFDTREADATPAPRGPTFSHTALADSPNYIGDHYDHRMLAVDFPNKRMTPFYGRILARDLAEFEAFNRHPGQEFLLVLAGSVRICFETGETLTLATNESAYFDSGVGHVYLSVGKKDAQVLMVMSG